MTLKTGFFVALLGPFLLGAGQAPAPIKVHDQNKVQSKGAVATVFHLSNREVATIFVHPGGSVLSFPAKPTKVVVGRENQFDVQYIEHDVAVVALSPSASANMFVYLLGRRYAFNLVTAVGKGERIITIRDPEDDRVEIEVK